MLALTPSRSADAEDATKPAPLPALPFAGDGASTANVSGQTLTSARPLLTHRWYRIAWSAKGAASEHFYSIAMMNPRTGAFDGQPSLEQQPCRRRPAGTAFVISDTGDVVFGALSASNPQVVTAFRGRLDNVALYNFTDGAPPADTCLVEP